MKIEFYCCELPKNDEIGYLVGECELDESLRVIRKHLVSTYTSYFKPVCYDVWLPNRKGLIYSYSVKDNTVMPFEINKIGFTDRRQLYDLLRSKLNL